MRKEPHMAMQKKNAAVAIFDHHSEAEAAIQELHRAGFDIKKLSIVGRDYHSEEHVVGYYNAGDRMSYWGKMGAFWGGIWGLLFGAAFFWVPGLGPLIVGGPLVSWIVAALEGALFVGGLSVLGAALYSIGIPKDSVLQYEAAVRSDRYLVVAHGTPDEVRKAKEILDAQSAAPTQVHLNDAD
jgi:uncharacterized membrane protein